ncbi:MAG TPA: hypothetical protein VF008_12340, partial [Niastella sp.]
MNLRIYCLAATAAMILHACVKQTQTSTTEESTNNESRTATENAIATNVAVTYTDESSFVSSLSS